jgi:lysozyme
MNMSEKGLSLLTQREGSRTKAYKDTKGIWTIGVGHTGPDVTASLVWTEQQVVDALRKDVHIAEKAIIDSVKVFLTQNQFDALCSFIFNVGVGAFKRSTLLKVLNLGNYTEAAKQFDRWNIPPEIVGRRTSEKLQFLQA